MSIDRRNRLLRIQISDAGYLLRALAQKVTDGEVLDRCGIEALQRYASTIAYGCGQLAPVVEISESERSDELIAEIELRADNNTVLQRPATLRKAS